MNQIIYGGEFISTALGLFPQMRKMLSSTAPLTMPTAIRMAVTFWQALCAKFSSNIENVSVGSKAYTCPARANRENKIE